MIKRREIGETAWRLEYHIRDTLDVLGGKDIIRELIKQWQNQGMDLITIWERLQKGGAREYEIKELLIGEPKAKA